jgi:hypothetical protein
MRSKVLLPQPRADEDDELAVGDLEVDAMHDLDSPNGFALRRLRPATSSFPLAKR